MSKEDITATRNEHASVELTKYVVVHRKRKGHESEDGAFVGSLEPFSGQTTNELVACRMGVFGAEKFRQGTKKTGLKGL